MSRPPNNSHVSERFYVVHLVDGTYELFRHRVEGFASRGLTILSFADVNPK